MEILKMEELKLVPHAIGRYIVELPSGSQLVEWHQTYQGTGPVRIARGFSAEQFEAMTKERAEKFRSVPHRDGGTLLEEVVELRIPFARAITFWEDEWFSKDTFVNCEAFYLKDGTLYRFHNAIYREPGRYERYFRGLERVMASIRTRRPDEIPSVPGSCFDGSILLDGPGRDYSEIVMATGIWPDRPDVRFRISIIDNGPLQDSPLLERLGRYKPLSGSDTIRSGNRKAGALEGQEHLERVTEENGTVGHLFIWETQGMVNRWDYPQIRLEMVTGEGETAPRHSTLRDADAVILWDRFLASWRWRPAK